MGPEKKKNNYQPSAASVLTSAVPKNESFFRPIRNFPYVP